MSVFWHITPLLGGLPVHTRLPMSRGVRVQLSQSVQEMRSAESDTLASLYIQFDWKCRLIGRDVSETLTQSGATKKERIAWINAALADMAIATTMYLETGKLHV